MGFIIEADPIIQSHFQDNIANKVSTTHILNVLTENVSTVRISKRNKALQVILANVDELVTTIYENEENIRMGKGISPVMEKQHFFTRYDISYYNHTIFSGNGIFK